MSRRKSLRDQLNEANAALAAANGIITKTREALHISADADVAFAAGLAHAAQEMVQGEEWDKVINTKLAAESELTALRTELGIGEEQSLLEAVKAKKARINELDSALEKAGNRISSLEQAHTILDQQRQEANQRADKTEELLRTESAFGREKDRAIEQAKAEVERLEEELTDVLQPMDALFMILSRRQGAGYPKVHRNGTETAALLDDVAREKTT